MLSHLLRRKNGSRPVQLPVDLILGIARSAIKRYYRALDRCKGSLGDKLIYERFIGKEEMLSADGSPFDKNIQFSLISITSDGPYESALKFKKRIIQDAKTVECMQDRELLFVYILVNGESLADKTKASLRNREFRELFETDITLVVAHEITHCTTFNFSQIGSSNISTSRGYINEKGEIAALSQEIWLCCKLFKDQYTSQYQKDPYGFTKFLNTYCGTWESFNDQLSPKNRNRLLSLAYSAVNEPSDT